MNVSLRQLRVFQAVAAHGNFTKEIVVYRGPYEYSVPGHPTDFTPQNAPDPKSAK